MLRRFVTFFTVVLLIGGATSLVYFNNQPTVIRLTPQHEFELRLGLLLLAAMLVGAAVVFLMLVAREGRHAFRQWRVTREKRIAERTTQHKVEARSLMLAGEHAKARALLERASRRSLPNVGDLVDYAETFAREGSPAKARQALEDGIKDFGNNPVLLYALARHCRALGDYAAAISAADRATASFPTSLDLFTLLRDLCVDTKAWVRAAEAQRHVVELAPTVVAEKERLLELRLAAAGTMQGADKDNALKAILAIDPDHVPTLAARARFLAAGGDARAAVKLLEKALKRTPAPRLVEALDEVAGEELAARAAKTIEKLEATYTADGALQLFMARRHLTQGAAHKADQALTAAEVAGADEHDTARVRAELAVAQGRPQDAVTFYRRALDAGA